MRARVFVPELSHRPRNGLVRCRTLICEVRVTVEFIATALTFDAFRRIVVLSSIALWVAFSCIASPLIGMSLAKRLRGQSMEAKGESSATR